LASSRRVGIVIRATSNPASQARSVIAIYRPLLRTFANWPDEIASTRMVCPFIPRC